MLRICVLVTKMTIFATSSKFLPFTILFRWVLRQVCSNLDTLYLNVFPMSEWSLYFPFQFFHFFSKPLKKGIFETLKKCPRIFLIQKKTWSGHREYVEEYNISKFQSTRYKSQQKNREPLEKSKGKLHPYSDWAFYLA